MCLFHWTPTCNHPSPHPAVARTCLTLAAQLWAAWAWALSVSSLSVLLSTLTLPSPICLMNRRNYTQDRKKTTKQKKSNNSMTAWTVTATGWEELCPLREGSIELVTWQHPFTKNRKEWTNQESYTIKKEDKVKEVLKKKNECHGRKWCERKAQSLHSPLCFATWDRRPLRQAHWLSASAPPLADTPLPCRIDHRHTVDATDWWAPR